MKNLRRRFDRFCFKNRDKGIPNLMLYIAIGNAIVLLMSMVNDGNFLYELLRFDKDMILRGQVWRLVSYVFTQSGGGFLSLIFLYFFYMLGRHVESRMGTLKFNLFYFSGVILMDVFAMFFCPLMPETIATQEEYDFLSSIIPVYWDMAYYLHLSLILTFATLYPESQFMILFIIPVKAWIIALIYLLLEFISVFNLSYPVMYFPHNLFPLVALGNYFLFTGSEIKNLIPLSWRIKTSRLFQKTSTAKTGTIPFPGTRQTNAAKSSAAYTHRCTVCGRTDVSNPELEFRYCSRCNGYYCYCEEHINNHSHIE